MRCGRGWQDLTPWVVDCGAEPSSSRTTGTRWGLGKHDLGPGRDLPPPASRAQLPTLLSLRAVSLGGGNCLCGLEQDTFFSSFFNAQMLGEGCGAGSWQGTGEERWPLPTVRMAKVGEHH